MVVGGDAVRDIAVVRFCCGDFTTLPFGDDQALAVGDAVVLIGYALALPGAATVTTGIVSARRYDSQHASYVIQTDASMNPGNSGGPMLDMQGNVIGINTYGIEQTSSGRPTEGLGFALSMSSIEGRIQELRVRTPSATSTPKPIAGNYFGPLSGELRHDAEDESIPHVYTSVDVADVEVEAVFFHPYDPVQSAWVHGFLLRATNNYALRISVRSDRMWHVNRWTEEKGFQTLHEGQVQGPLETGEGKQMHLRVILKGTSLQLYVNYNRVPASAYPLELDAEDLGSGEIGIATAMHRDAEVTGEVTRYEGFRGHPPP